MSHNMVCNTTVFTKNTRFTLVKQARKLRGTLHACKENAPLSVKEESTTRCMCACASNQVKVSMSSSIKSQADRYLCVHVMKALLEVFKRVSPRDLGVCARKIKRGYGYVYMCGSAIVTACVYCRYMYFNTAKECDYIRQLYFALKIIVSYFHISLPIAPHKEQHSQDTLTVSVSGSKS